MLYLKLPQASITYLHLLVYIINNIYTKNAHFVTT
jgi:hypothetical protein